MANQTLRELAKEHAQGNLDKDSYRKARAELLQGILTSKIPLKEIEYPPLVQPPEPESLDETQRKENIKKPSERKTDPDSTTSPKTPAEKATDNNNGNETGGSNKILIIGLALAIVAIIAVGILALTGEDKTGPGKTASVSTGTGTTTGASDSAAKTRTQAEQMISDFLAKKNWSNSNLDDFQQQWADLPAEDIQAARGSLALGQLTNAIFKQLLEEQALSGLVDDDSSSNKQRQLVEFASTLGIEDERISLPEEAGLEEDVIEAGFMDEIIEAGPLTDSEIENAAEETQF